MLTSLLASQIPSFHSKVRRTWTQGRYMSPQKMQSCRMA